MMRALRWPMAALLLFAGLVVAASVHRPGAAASGVRPSSSALPVTESAWVCPMGGGTASGPMTTTITNVSNALSGVGKRAAQVHTIPLTGVNAKPIAVSAHPVSHLRSASSGASVLVEAAGAGAGAVAADQVRLVSHGLHRGLLSAPCLQPGTDEWITGADGRVGYSDILLLANPGTTVANLTVTAWSTKGRVDPPKLESFTIPPNTVQLYAVADYAPDAALLTVHVHANTGRVAGAVLDRRVSGIRPAGIDWIPPTTPPATDLVVPGFLRGSGPRHLILAAPGGRDATVSLRLSTGAGNFEPAGHQTVVVRAGRSADVDITSSLAGAAGAVVVHSDQPVTATGLSSATGDRLHPLPDIQWQPAALPVSAPAVLANNTPPFNRTVRVYVTAPNAAAKVRVTTTTGATRVLSVAAGRTLDWDPLGAFGSAAYGPLVFTPAGGGAIYVSRTLYALGVHGPLTTAEQPVQLPAAISLPAAVPDERVAVPGGR
jgi:hypothetical protein